MNQDEAPIIDTIVKDEEETSQETATGLSKSALKRLRSKQRWLEHRKVKREEEKARKKEKRQAIIMAGGQLPKKFRKGKQMNESECKIRIAVDMSFDDLMSDKDRSRCVSQLAWCYSVNRRMDEPTQYYVTSFNGASRQIYDGIESNHNQDIHLRIEGLDDLFEKDEIVYLTAESENVLEKLEDNTVYVIGGLVDHNAHKGLCFEIAKRNGYSHARLPIDEFVNMKTRKVLTINHVFAILAHFTQSKDWEKSFLSIIPKRKGMEKKTTSLDEQSDEDGEDQCNDEEESKQQQLAEQDTSFS